jgi:hypothetical protein
MYVCMYVCMFDLSMYAFLMYVCMHLDVCTLLR